MHMKVATYQPLYAYNVELKYNQSRFFSYTLLKYILSVPIYAMWNYHYYDECPHLVCCYHFVSAIDEDWGGGQTA